MQQTTFDSSKSWISFSVEGLQNISVYGEAYSFKTTNDDLIEEVEILQENNCISNIRCILKNKNADSANIIELVHTKIKNFLLIYMVTFNQHFAILKLSVLAGLFLFHLIQIL